MSIFEKLPPLWRTKSENLVCHDNAHKTSFGISMLLPTAKIAYAPGFIILALVNGNFRKHRKPKKPQRKILL